MFLNLHSKTPKRLSLQPNFGRQTYLSHNSLSHFNKEKSYSTASLKEEFRKFKNKSLSHALNNNTPISQIKSSLNSPTHFASKDGRAQFNGSSFMKNGYQNGSNLKINDFKKSYLNLDSKLNKCTMPKDYFKPIQQNSSRYATPASYIEVQKRLQQENIRKQLTLMEEISLLRNENQILKRQNQELRKQRSIDLELITRQNQIMQKQEELIDVSQQAINAKSIHFNSINRQPDHGSYTFSNNLKIKPKSPHQCEDCYRNKKENLAQTQFMEIKMLKMEEENKYLKNQIHQLVYQCEKFKEALRKAEEKYHKQLEQNQKLIGLIYQTDKQKSYEEKVNSKNYINREMYLNYKQEKDFCSQNKPISLKREKGKIYHPENRNDFKSNVNSPKKNLGQKSSNTKSAINLLKFSDQASEEFEIWEHVNNQESLQKRDIIKEEKMVKQKQKSREQNMQWCQNQNIRKYLEQINKQKAKEIDKIDFLLGYQ